MTEKIKKYWHALNRPVLLNQRELVLGVAACTLAGLAAGMLLSPGKQIYIGSNHTVSPAAPEKGQAEAEKEA